VWVCVRERERKRATDYGVTDIIREEERAGEEEKEREREKDLKV
jgi:hypothetical protein